MDLKDLQGGFTRFFEHVKGKAAVLQRKAAVLLCLEDGVQEFEFGCLGDPELLESSKHESKPPGQIQPPRYAQSSSGNSPRNQSPRTFVTRYDGDSSILRSPGDDNSSAYTFGHVREPASACRSPNQPIERAVDPSLDLSPPGPATDSRQREASIYCRDLPPLCAIQAHPSDAQQADNVGLQGYRESPHGVSNKPAQRDSFDSGSIIVLPSLKSSSSRGKRMPTSESNSLVLDRAPKC
ncbi:hypothetical protein BDW69DRAFT_188853 [Aspergillus filifer]